MAEDEKRQSLRAKLLSTLFAPVPSLLVFALFAPVPSFGGALLTEALALQFGLPFPGLIVWDWLHPDRQSASMGSMLLTWLVVDSACWFIVLMVAGFLIDRAGKRKSRLG
jgi:hypothetical protein